MSVTLNVIATVMLSIAPIESVTLYHVQQTQTGDYYDPGQTGERPGFYTGLGAKQLELEGHVTPEAFQSLMLGMDPTTKRALVKNANSATRDVAWDLCFSAPKSYSVLWALADDRTRQLMDEAFLQAISLSCDRIDATVRVGKKGERVAASPVISVFVHSSGRAPHDPQLHAHVYQDTRHRKGQHQKDILGTVCVSTHR